MGVPLRSPLETDFAPLPCTTPQKEIDKLQQGLDPFNGMSQKAHQELENAIRDLDDAEIKKHWQKFVESKTEAQAQQGVKELLGILVNKVKE